MNANLEMEFGERLVSLRSGEAGLRGGLRVSASAPADCAGEAVVDFVSSDETLDRYDEVICASGWALARYLKNPVFQDSHDYSTILRTIGKAVVTEVRGNRLYQRISFAVDANPLARIAHAMYRGGFLNAVSVGFIPLEWENGGAGSGFARRYLKQELVETSAVAIPANPNALECAVKAGAVGKSEIGELMDILRWLSAGAAGAERENFAGAGFNAGAPESGTNGAQLVQLMREVAAIHRRA